MISEEMKRKAGQAVDARLMKRGLNGEELAVVAIAACESELLAQGMEKAAEIVDEFQYGFQAASAIRASAARARANEN